MSAAGSISSNPMPSLMSHSLFGGQTAIQVAAGQFHTLVQTADKRLWGFGRNFKGNLGSLRFGTSIPVAEPVCISCLLPEQHTVLDFAGGSDHTVMIVRDEISQGPPLMFGELSPDHRTLSLSIYSHDSGGWHHAICSVSTCLFVSLAISRCFSKARST